MTSQEYWKKREAEQLKHNITDEQGYKTYIDKIYDSVLDNVQKEIAGFYAKYANKEGITLSEAKRRVSKLDIEEYGRKAEKYVKDRTFSKEANEEMRLYNATMRINRIEMLKANIGLELVDGFDELQQYYDTILTDRTLSEYERQAGILGKSIVNNEKVAHSIVNASFNNAKYSDRIWMYQDMLKNELAGLLKTGLIQGRNPRQLATHLQKLFGVAKSRAETLMRTELARVQTDAQMRAFKENGYDKYIFIAEDDSRTCNVCISQDNEVFEVKDMQIGVTAPPLHPNCRCSTAAYMDRKDFNEWLSEQNGESTLNEQSESDKINSKIEDAMNYVLDRGKETNTEHLVFLNVDGSDFVPRISGSKSKVQVPRETVAKLRQAEKDSTLCIHNHPGSSSFSPEDMGFASGYDAIKEMLVEGHDGTRYRLAISEGVRPSYEVIDDAYWKIRNELESKYPNAHEIPVWKEYSNEIVSNIAQMFGWEYERTLS